MLNYIVVGIKYASKKSATNTNKVNYGTTKRNNKNIFSKFDK